MIKKIAYMGCLLLATSSVFAESETHWSYSGETGPSEWSKLKPEYSACAGKNQSPINLTGFIEANLQPIKFSYSVGASDMVNNGHTVQINYPSGNSIVVDNIKFELKQLHFHAPSENQINGKSYPMEVHLVHADTEGNLAVVAVMFKEAATNKALATLWPMLPKEMGEKVALPPSFAANTLLPNKRDYYRFNGSLTTPPCSEGVRWLVMKKAVSVSKEQVEAFLHSVHHENNRPVQAVNARPVLQ